MRPSSASSEQPRLKELESPPHDKDRRVRSAWLKWKGRERSSFFYGWRESENHRKYKKKLIYRILNLSYIYIRVFLFDSVAVPLVFMVFASLCFRAGFNQTWSARALHQCGHRPHSQILSLRQILLLLPAREDVFVLFVLVYPRIKLQVFENIPF